MMESVRPQGTQPEISVIIPCRNAAKVIDSQLSALVAQECEVDWELVIADDGSTDDTIEVIRRYESLLPALRIVRDVTRRGAAAARNAGARMAAAEHLLFLDADDSVNETYLQRMAVALRHHGLVCAALDFERLNSPAILTSNPRPRTTETQHMFKFLPHAGGGCLGVRKEVFLAVGGFDETIPWLHDADLCWRVQLTTGEPLHVVPGAIEYVRLRNTLTSLFRQGIANGRDGIRLRRRYAAFGVPWTPWSRHLRQWLKVIRALALSARPEPRAEFAWRLGKQIGRLHGLLTDGR
ncbi:glycosyltransferase [Nonomuraea sp. NPDC050451]|uniref:glycosyltransferase n=1 Tax=Nonomuraea sp. NPDC050451 TaxID=3364364 RepID=UPI0037A26101